MGCPQRDGPSLPSLGAISVSVDGGLHVIHVNPDSTAERGGLEPGDILTLFKDTAIAASSDLNRILATVEWGDEAPLMIRRDETPEEITLTFRR